MKDVCFGASRSVCRRIRTARTLKAVTVGHAGAGHSVYVICCTMGGDISHGGCTSARHRAILIGVSISTRLGTQASGSARRFGVCLLPELVEHLNPMRQWESLDLEAALADAFRAAGVPWVEGGH